MDKAASIGQVRYGRSSAHLAEDEVVHGRIAGKFRDSLDRSLAQSPPDGVVSKVHIAAAHLLSQLWLASEAWRAPDFPHWPANELCEWIERRTSELSYDLQDALNLVGFPAVLPQGIVALGERLALAPDQWARASAAWCIDRCVLDRISARDNDMPQTGLSMSWKAWPAWSYWLFNTQAGYLGSFAQATAIVLATPPDAGLSAETIVSLHDQVVKNCGDERGQFLPRGVTAQAVSFGTSAVRGWTPDGTREWRQSLDEWNRIAGVGAWELSPQAGDKVKASRKALPVPLIMEVLTHLVDQYRERRARSADSAAKVRAIVQLCQGVERAHAFSDANGRTALLLLQRELLLAQEPPCILHDPCVLDGACVDKVSEAVREGQAWARDWYRNQCCIEDRGGHATLNQVLRRGRQADRED